MTPIVTARSSEHRPGGGDLLFPAQKGLSARVGELELRFDV
jgi:hypothetical protein